MHNKILALVAAILLSFLMFFFIRNYTEIQESKYKNSFELTAIDELIYYTQHQDAHYTIVEYIDLNCKYCKSFHFAKNNFIKSNPKINFAIKIIPLINRNQSTFKSQIAQCVMAIAGVEEVKKYIDYLYQNFDERDLENPHIEFISNLYADESFKTCVDSLETKTAISQSLSQAYFQGIYTVPTLAVFYDKKFVKMYELNSSLVGLEILNHYAQ